MDTDLLKKAEEILNKADLPDRHTFFQLEKFNIGKEPTAQARLWQIVREMQARMETVDSYRKQLEDAEDNLELFDLKIARLSRQIREEAKQEATYTDLNIGEYEINIRKLKREKEALVLASRKVRKKLKCILEELTFLAESYEKTVKCHGEIKPIDDPNAQRELWNEKLLEEFNLRIILQRPLDTEFVRTVLCLGDEAPVKQHIVKLLTDVQTKMIQRSQEAKIGNKHE
jgi:hypothetical protein